jgi:hypothetical protein
MKAWIVCAALAAIGLGGCQKPADTVAGLFGGGHGKGRYFGVGLYPAGRMWSQVVGAATSKDPAAAAPKDDEEIIVVLDSASGELRQCGSLSGACIAMNPWSSPLAASRQSPVPLGKHAEQLDADDAQADAEAAKKGQAQIHVRVRGR